MLPYFLRSKCDALFILLHLIYLYSGSYTTLVSTKYIKYICDAASGTQAEKIKRPGRSRGGVEHAAYEKEQLLHWNDKETVNYQERGYYRHCNALQYVFG